MLIIVEKSANKATQQPYRNRIPDNGTEFIMNTLTSLLLTAKRAALHVRGNCASVALQNGYQPLPAIGSSLPSCAGIGMYQGWFKSTR